MKKFFSNLKAVVSCAVIATMVASSVVSCQYDDTELRGEIDNVKKELADLRTDLQSQIDALKGLVDGQVTVKSVVTNEDGTTTVTLSDDTVITVQPEASLDGVITIVEYDGVKYWAQYNAEGEAVLISVDGANCPVMGAEPQTRVNEQTNSIEVSFDGGITWVATGSYTGVVKAEIIYSEWQFDEEGNPLALYAQFTMADGTVVKAHVEGQAIQMWSDSAYAAFGQTTTLPIYANIGEFADYMFQLPAGWSAEVVEDEYAKENMGVIGEVNIYFTAPSAAAVESGAAVAEGEAKMLVSFQNGSSAIAKMRVTTKVADITVSADGFSFENNGWDPYAYGSVFYGICKMADFDKAMIVEDIANWGYTYGLSLGYVYFDESNVFSSDWSVYPEELVAGEQYVVWLAPGMIDQSTYCPVTTEADINYAVYTHFETSFEVVEAQLLDVDAKFTIAGSDVFGGFMAGVTEKSYFDIDYVAQSANDSSWYWEYGYTKADGEYTGKLTAWAGYGPDILKPGTDYVLHVIPGNASLVFTAADVLTWEFRTKELEKSGGTITLTVDEENTYNSYDSMNVSFESSADITVAYYKYVPKFEAAAYATDEAIVDFLLDPETEADIIKTPGTSFRCNAGTWDVPGEPGDEYTLFVVAAEADGKLGKPVAYDYNYKAIEYNDLTVSVEVTSNYFDNVTVDVACEGAYKFLYKIMDVTSYQWTEYCKSSADGASQWFVMNADSPYTIHHSDNNSAAYYYGCIFEDNQIKFSSATADTTYVVAVAAKDENGGLSKVTCVEFTAIMNMGTIRYATDAEWETSKPEVKMYAAEIVGDFYTFDWTVAPKEGYTAYTIGEHTGNFTEYNVDTTDAKAMIKYIVSHSDVVECAYSADGYKVDKGSYDEYWDWVENLVEVPGVYCSCHYGTEGMMEIWTTWKDAEGNYFEPFMIKAEM